MSIPRLWGAQPRTSIATRRQWALALIAVNLPCPPLVLPCPLLVCALPEIAVLRALGKASRTWQRRSAVTLDGGPAHAQLVSAGWRGSPSLLALLALGDRAPAICAGQQRISIGRDASPRWHAPS